MAYGAELCSAVVRRTFGLEKGSDLIWAVTEGRREQSAMSAKGDMLAQPTIVRLKSSGHLLGAPRCQPRAPPCAPSNER